MKTVSASGETIASLQTDIANAQTNASMKAYANNVRLANRAVADARGLAGGAGGSRLGSLQRESTMLGFGLQQREITTRLALAQFQAPGETGEERFARQQEEVTKAKIAQRQLSIGRETFGIEAGRGVTDTTASRGVMQAEHEAAMVAAAASKQITAEQLKQSQAMAKASQIVQQAEDTFSLKLSAASQFVAQFGGVVSAAMTAIATAMGIEVPRASDKRSKYGDEKANARGFVGMAKGPTRALMGEAGDEAVAILRNPRAADLGMGRPSSAPAPGGDFTVNLNINAQVRNDGDIQAIANAVERVLGKKAQLLGYRSPSY